MSTGGLIHWYEGLFLQPHHLQAMQREAIGRAASERALGFAYPYGVVESDLSRDALENRIIRFDRLRIVMPGGLELNVPEDSDLAPLDISKKAVPASGSLLIKIGVPMWYPLRANTIDLGSEDGKDVKRRYRVRETELVDENTGRNTFPVQLRRINAKLLVDGEDETDLEVLPLVRVANPAAGDVGLPRRDDEFFPPCLLMEGWPPLRDLIQELVDQVEATRSQVVKDITREGFDIQALKPVQFKQLLKLQTLNRLTPRLRHYVRVRGVPPLETYLILRELLGELAALQPNEDLYELPDYDHDNCAVGFIDLCDRIRTLLGGEEEAAFIKIPLKHEQGAYAAKELKPEHLGLAEYYLAINSATDPAQVAALVHNPDKFKFMPFKRVHAAVRGVELRFDHHPPSQLPSGAGLSYFRLVRGSAASQKMWDYIADEKALGVTFPGVDASDFQMTLYGRLPK
jgi:type VI secretion system protein ImpJ